MNERMDGVEIESVDWCEMKGDKRCEVDTYTGVGVDADADADASGIDCDISEM